MTLALLWIQLAVAAIVILGASLYLAKSADIIAIKTGLGRSFVGVVLLATATSLPELGTGISAVSFVGQPDLAFGGAFGSNLFNLFIIGLIDIFWWNRYLLNYVGMTSVVIGVLGIVIIGLATMAAILHGMTTVMDGWFVSPMSVALIVVFAIAMYFIYSFGKRQERQTDDQEHDVPKRYKSARLSRYIAVYVLSATIVVVAAVWLSIIGDELAIEMGWRASFMGTQFLAAATSLPELATSVAALRIMAPELAITNLLGSNLFNMGFLLFLDDAAHTSGAIWAAVSPIHVLTGVIAIVMTSIVVLAVVSRSRSDRASHVTIESGLLIGTYAIASFLVFSLG